MVLAVVDADEHAAHGGGSRQRHRDVLARHGSAGPASVIDLLQVPGAAAVPGVLQVPVLVAVREVLLIVEHAHEQITHGFPLVLRAFGLLAGDADPHRQGRWARAGTGRGRLTPFTRRRPGPDDPQGPGLADPG